MFMHFAESFYSFAIKLLDIAIAISFYYAIFTSISEIGRGISERRTSCSIHEQPTIIQWGI